MTDMILPKGIVFNRNTIYEEIAKYDIVPLEKIHAACHVFSTTSRELVDPTARRLENFWTRVLGGDRRYLSGRVIARIFQSISEEESFVKLRGPANRYEPPSPESKAELPARVQAAIPETSRAGPSEAKSKGKSKATKSTPSSSTKQPHPILKKPRGPSNSGPRPKTRFVSPSGSDDESKDADLASSGSTAVNHSGDSKVSTSSTAKEDRKKATNTTPKKKTTFVASTASRRRPGMPRRISSQSSTAVSGSDVGSREGGSPGLRQPESQGLATVIQGEKLEKGSSTSEGGERLSAKAAGKRPARRLSPEKSATSKPSTTQATSAHDQPSVAQSKFSNVKQLTPTANTTNEAIVENNLTTAGQGGAVHRRSDTQERPRPNVAPVMTRSRSDMGGGRRSSTDLTRGRVPPQALISSSTATISHETAQGTIIEFDENTPAYQAVTSAVYGQDDDIETGSRRSGSSILDSRFTPTQPNPTPAVPLGRSKSQLTLLLERQGDKKGRR
ncbi:hypothetical protein F4821DRAFT_66094 [Hypoxylon rubiginosum]|uniref:Uncharacterized protein n=1 Tax=Hypoxylon rubiginosum TaxID=110542 RepID=A0ACC0D8Z1_9PEZI|nr:hypothetical protein F4821DRAFT_66094 [Hypoxylon rubiginosum]